MRHTLLANLRGLVRLARLPFMIGGVLFYALGVSLALWSGHGLRWAPLLLGQLAVTAAQIMNAMSNDVFDLPADRLNQTYTRWSGGSRALPDGLLSPRLALAAALTFGGIALLAGVGLALTPGVGPWATPLVILGTLWAWFYSAPPIALHRTGAGEFGGALLLAVYTPLLGFYLQTGRFDERLLLAVAPFYFWQVAMILAVSIPDGAGDALAGKHTLFVRLGGRRAARLYVALLAAGYLMLAAWPRAGLPPWLPLTLLAGLPLAAYLARRMWRGDWADPTFFPALCFWTIGHLIAGVAATDGALLAATLLAG